MKTKLVLIFLLLAVISTQNVNAQTAGTTKTAQTNPPVDPNPQTAADSKTEMTDIKGTIAKAPKAHAEMQSKSGSKVTGTVSFTDTATGIQGNYSFKGLAPNQVFGFHIHEKGDCSSPDGKSAGTHYMKVAPTGGTSLQTPEKYAGDLPQVKSDKDGNATGSFNATGLTINKKNPIVDRAIILHGGGDDPTKASPPRIACGVIKQASK